ncbi:hypothetical protein ACHAWF_008108, partial [Thalassiosira exigua]
MSEANDGDVESPASSPAPAPSPAPLASAGAPVAPPSAADVAPSSPPPPPPTRPDASSPSSPTPVRTAPEPPRWRFVNDAKKSSGYSTRHAGSFVKGKSSEELGAKYVAPDVSLYKPKAEQIADVGKLGDRRRSTGGVRVPISEVGKLVVRGSSDVGDEFSGAFRGLPERGAGDEARAPFKQWGVDYEASPKAEGDQVVHDGSVDDTHNDNKSDDASLGKTTTTVGKIGFLDPVSDTDVIAGGFSKGKNQPESDVDRDAVEAINDGHIDGVGSDALSKEETSPNGTNGEVGSDSGNAGNCEADGLREEALSTKHTEGSPPSTAVPVPQSTEVDDKKKKRKWLFLLLLLPIIFAIILGVVLGTKDEKDRGAAGLVAPIVIIETSVPSSEPSSQPSSMPSRKCPIGTNAFTIEHGQQMEQLSPSTRSDGAHISWVVKDACTGDLIYQCPPCSSESSSLPQDPQRNRTQANETRLRRVLDEDLPESNTQCLPIDNEYVFDLLPVENASEACCGFDPASSTISYDDMVIHEASNGNVFGDSSDRVYFGEREVPCQSEPPSASPSHYPSGMPSSTPSENPSSDPSSEPSSSPSISPSTSPPTQSPVVFLGGCPDPFVAMTNYAVGAQVESNGIMYECKSASCAIYMPGSDRGSAWRQVWEIVGSCSGTRPPTQRPTVTPTSSPTNSPSGSPTKSPTESPSGSPSKGPTVAPSDMPTRSPSKSPTRGPSSSPTPPPSISPIPPQPTRQPTDNPTPQPTCAPERAFNLCIALDMSGKLQLLALLLSYRRKGHTQCVISSFPPGSICNGSFGSECLDCQREVFLFLTNRCGESDVDMDTCCNNFAKMQEFSSDLVFSLDAYPKEKAFSIVRFSTDATEVEALSPAGDVIKAIEKLDYSGGLTNHESAIETCQRSFDTIPGRKNFIMLVTDGEASTPSWNAEALAEQAAEVAKSGGTYIIPVFISTGRIIDQSALEYMQRLGSAGTVFYVNDFDSLNDLQSELIDQV